MAVGKSPPTKLCAGEKHEDRACARYEDRSGAKSRCLVAKTYHVAERFRLATPGQCVSGGMRRQRFLPIALVLFTFSTFAQEDEPTFKVKTESALVWDKDLPPSTTASVVWDPATGRELHRLRHAGIEVSSRMGYERLGPGSTGKLLNYTTTIANNTNSDLTVRYGGFSVEGQGVLPLRIALSKKDVKKRERKDVLELSKMHCFKIGFASSENFFSGDALSKHFTVRTQTAMTISAVSKDPRSHSAQCSVDGCQITGTIRYYITVNGKDYVFVWSGPSVVDCGE